MGLHLTTVRACASGGGRRRGVDGWELGKPGGGSQNGADDSNQGKHQASVTTGALLDVGRRHLVAKTHHKLRKLSDLYHVLRLFRSGIDNLGAACDLQRLLLLHHLLVALNVPLAGWRQASVRLLHTDELVDLLHEVFALLVGRGTSQPPNEGGQRTQTGMILARWQGVFIGTPTRNTPQKNFALVDMQDRGEPIGPDGTTPPSGLSHPTRPSWPRPTGVDGHPVWLSISSGRQHSTRKAEHTRTEQNNQK